MLYSTKMNKYVLPFCLIAQNALSLKIGVISDIHVNLAYDATVSAKDDCTTASNKSNLLSES